MLSKYVIIIIRLSKAETNHIEGEKKMEAIDTEILATFQELNDTEKTALIDLLKSLLLNREAYFSPASSIAATTA